MLLNARELSLAFGVAPVLDRVSLSIEAGERIALLGRNGTGKSSLLKVLAGEIKPDDGAIGGRDGLRVARLEQTMQVVPGQSVRHVVSAGCGPLGALLERYTQLGGQLADAANAADSGLLQELESTQQAIEAADGWGLQQRVDATLARLGLTPEADYDRLSGGLKRRALLARALVSEPDLLLLDEPTNHLDVDGIRQLEELLLGFGGAVLFITHDRAFLSRLATRILLLDRGQLTSYPGDYQRFLATRDRELEAEQQQQSLFDKQLAAEERWIRQGIKARRTRNEGRVRALESMRRERAARRSQQGRADFSLQTAERSGKLVLEARGIAKRLGERTLFEDLSLTVLRGDKIGLIGANGSGKTTLLQVLLKTLEPDRGDVRHGTRLDIAYFDQLRATLDESATVAANVTGGRDTVLVNGRERHIHSYLSDFLFTPAQVRGPISALSGGERNRLLLARLFTRSANLLVLDEPTNDLDLETLELLEELLTGFAGTVLLVSHDRAFLDQVVTSCLVFEGDGKVTETVGGYSDAMRQLAASAQARATPSAQARNPQPRANPAAALQPATRGGDRLRFKEQRELAELPARIAALESTQQSLTAELSDPDLYRKSPGRVATASQRLTEVEQALEAAMQRWIDLEERADGS
jgi:ABC transport system ATP-binding/permease protein